ncbi:GSCOCG00006578001-RA-CDS [Cotesia congregata]|nr:GSCOCG00006578001-RA-CDS [Cotesia congregata]
MLDIKIFLILEMDITTELYIKIIGGVQIKSLVLKISIGGFDFVASSDNFDDEEESNEWSANISQLVPIVISDHHDPIVAFVTPKIIAAINQQLQNNLLKNNNDNADISISNISGYNNSAFILCINYYVNTHTKKHCKGNLE